MDYTLSLHDALPIYLHTAILEIKIKGREARCARIAKKAGVGVCGRHVLPWGGGYWWWLPAMPSASILFSSLLKRGGLDEAEEGRSERGCN